VVGALLFRRRAIALLGLAGLCALGPVMGFCVPWRLPAGSAPDNKSVLRVATFNVGGRIDSAGMIQFFREFRPDVVAFQEWPQQLGFPEEIEAGWHSEHRGELFIASRYPIIHIAKSDVARGRRRPAAIRCDVETPAGTVHVHCLHLYTLRDGLDPFKAKKWKGAPEELERVSAIRNEDSEITGHFACECAGPALVLGDFNMTGDSTIFHRDWTNWQDAFSTAGWGLGYTFLSTRIGLRIDHILADRRHWHVRSCRVGPDLKVEHRPVVAELLLLDQD
jgi:vancomycin resistance protein VanJ